MENQTPSGSTSTGAGLPLNPKRRFGGMIWILIVIGIVFVIGFAVSALKKRNPPPAAGAPAITADSSAFGVDEFETVEGGVSFGAVDPPGGPADKAGLVGGDTLISFDGRALKDAEAMTNLLRQTAVGKTVEVTYLRDGENKKTQLTTISAQARDDLADAFDERAEGQGQLGFDDGQARRVPIPGTTMHGVQLRDLGLSGPAALAGIQPGDIVIEFDRAPIRTLSELILRVRRSIPYSTVKVVIMRKDEKVELQVKMGRRRE